MRALLQSDQATSATQEGVVRRVVGALVEASPCHGVALGELCRVGPQGLLAEVLRKDGDRATVQVFEETNGLGLGATLSCTGAPLTAELGPGLLGAVLDGVGRRLADLARSGRPYIAPGVSADTLERSRRWTFVAERQPGDEVAPGDVLGRVQETPRIAHRILVPPGVGGRLQALASGSYRVTDTIGSLADNTPLRLMQRWPIQRPRPIGERLPSDRPFVTGQRVLDLLVPAAEGGTVAVPGGFGTGKTVIEQSLAKHAHADVVVYVGCGERGNEIAEVLAEFAELKDGSGAPVLDRTVLVVNTSNMPVAARQASVYLGLTIAEYYRDMGYRVAMMADSISRWAEALREIGSRLGDMPGEEGYPTYLASRLAAVHERAGRVVACGAPHREGAVTLINAVSPPGGDFSEPVTQACLRVAGALWALDPKLAHQRQFPAVDWQQSYSAYAELVAPWFKEHAGPRWSEVRRELVALLQRDRELRDVAELVGTDALGDPDRLILEVARLIREAVLGQSAVEPGDAFSPPTKTLALAQACLELYRRAGTRLAAGAAYEALELGAARRAIVALRSAALDAAAPAAELTRVLDRVAGGGRP